MPREWRTRLQCDAYYTIPRHVLPTATAPFLANEQRTYDELPISSLSYSTSTSIRPKTSEKESYLDFRCAGDPHPLCARRNRRVGL